MAELLYTFKFSAVAPVAVAIKKLKHSANYSEFGKNTAKFYQNIHRRLEFIANEVVGLTYNLYSKIQQIPRKTLVTEFLQNRRYKPATVRKINFIAKTFLESFGGYTEHIFFRGSLL